MVRCRQLLLTSWLVVDRVVMCGINQQPLVLSIRLRWLGGVARLYECANPSQVSFPDAFGELGVCTCSGVCARDTCLNAMAAVYCDSGNCDVGVGCGNRLEELVCLRLVRCRFGLGVASAVTLPPGVAVGEYCGVLRRGDDFTEAMRGTGFGFEFRKRSTTRERVYVDASRSGSLFRFVNHSCVPNCRFEVMMNRGMRKVAVVTTEVILAGGELTVKYCGRLWFECRCIACVCAGG